MWIEILNVKSVTDLDNKLNWLFKMLLKVEKIKLITNLLLIFAIAAQDSQNLTTKTCLKIAPLEVRYQIQREHKNVMF